MRAHDAMTNGPKEKDGEMLIDECGAPRTGDEDEWPPRIHLSRVCLDPGCPHRGHRTCPHAAHHFAPKSTTPPPRESK